jgi:hypothetical protein
MLIFSKAFPLMKKGYRIRIKRWPELYFISLEENKVYDSCGNLYTEDFEEYLIKNSDVQDNAGHIWELYYEVLDENL